MQIADEDTHRSLTYLAAATRSGARLTAAQLDVYAVQPDRAGPKYQGTLGLKLSSDWARSFANAFGDREMTSPAESMSKYLVRLSWAVTDEPGNVALTDLGRSVLHEMNNPRIDISDEDPISVIVDPKDPLAYARIFELIVSQTDGMLVDPWLRLQEFFEITQLPAVARILISDHDLKVKRPVLSQALSSLPEPPEIRYLPNKEMHDRFFIPDSGDVIFFGSSLNSITKRPGVVSPISDAAASNAIREAYEAMWLRATPIEPIAKSEE